MVAGTGEPSAKRAKVEEAKEEEDPLVRRKEEVVRLLGRARKGKDNARAKEELLNLCDDFEAKNEKLLRRLLPELWQKILDENVQQNDLLAFAMTCRFFREKQKDLGKKVETYMKESHLLELRKTERMASHSLGWFRWVCDTWKILPGYKRYSSECERGAVYEGDLLNYAAFQGSVELLRRLMEEKGWESNWQTGYHAGMGGSVEILKYLGGKGYEFTRGECTGAAKGGHLEALKFLRGLDPPCPWDVMTGVYAARLGHLDILKWIRSQNPPCPWDRRTCSEAAREGHLEVLKFLRAQNPPCPWEYTCDAAAGEGYLEILKWLRDQDPPCPWDARTCIFAVKYGHLEVLMWARAQEPPCPWTEQTCAGAAQGGHLDILKWLRSQDPPCPWDRSTCSGAARGGHLEVLKWARDQDPPCPWGEKTCSGAAGGGHLEILKWARSQDPPCPWDPRTCSKAAWEGHRLDLMLTTDALRKSQLGHQHVIDWIDQQED
ncbi:ANK_REP_REGION domain-containing protein [Chloropicon roscoffensis]|uniref:ANK_REP_REGION domain-containing protein n=1 Tax=Chloropicon roscoffensis TaxID=1461544 RepID=A0AAX4P5Z8_9CHLO